MEKIYHTGWCEYEVKMALKRTEYGKAARVDGMTPEPLNADLGETANRAVNQLFSLSLLNMESI